MSKRAPDTRLPFPPISNSPDANFNAKISFGSLEENVRNIIWDYARSRTIKVETHNGLLYSRSPSPITFRINRESRDITIHLYNFHEKFYILGTNHSVRVNYPFFDPKIDSVVMSDSFTEDNQAMTTKALGFYADAPVVRGYSSSHFDIVRSLVVPAHDWNWAVICRLPRANIQFGNLTEIVLQGGQAGLITPEDVESCREVIKACFERNEQELAAETNNNGSASAFGTLRPGGPAMDPRNRGRLTMTLRRRRGPAAAIQQLKVPQLKVVLPGNLGYEWNFGAEELGMESSEERKFVLDFINKVKDDRSLIIE